jgi:hypothetical protein
LAKLDKQTGSFPLPRQRWRGLLPERYATDCGHFRTEHRLTFNLSTTRQHHQYGSESEFAFTITMSNLAIEQHPKLIQALSMVPHSPLFGVLWPIIIDQASYDTRLLLSKVNDYFAGLCRPHEASDWAKKVRPPTWLKVPRFANGQYYRGICIITEIATRDQTSHLSLSSAPTSSGDAGGPISIISPSHTISKPVANLGIRCGFNNVASFRAFCAIGDIDPDQGREWKRSDMVSKYYDLPPNYVWLSRSKDIVFETSCNPLTNNGYCHYFGLTGVADKAIAMYDYVHDGYSIEESDETGTFWDEMSWSRDYC